MKEQGVYISFMYNNHSDQNNKIKTITASDFLSFLFNFIDVISFSEGIFLFVGYGTKDFLIR